MYGKAQTIGQPQISKSFIIIIIICHRTKALFRKLNFDFTCFQLEFCQPL